MMGWIPLAPCVPPAPLRFPRLGAAGVRGVPPRPHGEHHAAGDPHCAPRPPHRLVLRSHPHCPDWGCPVTPPPLYPWGGGSSGDPPSCSQPSTQGTMHNAGSYGAAGMGFAACPRAPPVCAWRACAHICSVHARANPCTCLWALCVCPHLLRARSCKPVHIPMGAVRVLRAVARVLCRPRGAGGRARAACRTGVT